MVRDDFSDLPAFVFPVVAWAPEAATGIARYSGVGGFFSPRDVVMQVWPEGNPRLGWTFVDSAGRRWEVKAVRITGKAKVLLQKILSISLYEAEYRLVCDWVERPPVTFEVLRERLLLAATANPTAYRGEYGRRFRTRLETAQRISDLFKYEDTIEADEIRSLVAISLFEQWLTCKGRCSRRAFGAVFAALGAVWLSVWLGGGLMNLDGTVRVFLFFGSMFLSMSLIVRRLHDLGETGWWAAHFWVWGIVFGFIGDVFRNTGGLVIAGWAWWIPSLCAVAWLAVLPGTLGPNRYGFGRKGAG